MKLRNLFFDAPSIKHTAERKVWVWSDLHLYHDRDFIYGPRGFKSCADMTTAILRAWRDNVGPHDTLFLLGDTMFGIGGDQRLMDLFIDMPYGDLYLMPGNHFSGYKQCFDQLTQKHGATSFPLEPSFGHQSKHLHFIPNYFECFINQQPFVMSHYPILSWNGYSKGSYLLYGHVHGNLKHDLGKAMDMGIEKCPRPQSFWDIDKFMKAKPIKIVDQHGKGDKNPFGPRENPEVLCKSDADFLAFIVAEKKRKQNLESKGSFTPPKNILPPPPPPDPIIPASKTGPQFV